MIGTVEAFASNTLKITAGDGGNTVYVVFTDYAPRCGQVIITCWDGCWMAWFNAMGNLTIRQFVAMADAGYLHNKMRTPKMTRRDHKFLERAIGLVKEALAAEVAQ